MLSGADTCIRAHTTCTLSSVALEPMQEVTYCSSDVVILSLAQDESCRCVEYILQGPDVNSAGAVHLEINHSDKCLLWGRCSLGVKYTVELTLLFLHCTR